MSYVLDGTGFLEATDAYPQNWVLVPGPSKSVRLFHSCFAAEKKLLGISGCRVTAPFKQISLAGVSSSISVPPDVRGRSDGTIPTLAQFLKVVDEEEFSTLIGLEGSPVSDLAKHPNSFWIHPHLFLSVAGPQSIRAAEMAMLILLSISEEKSEDDELPTEDEIGIYNLLVFLWAVEKRWAPAVSITDPVDSLETGNACSRVAKRLELWRTSKENQEEDDASEESEKATKRESKEKRTKKSRNKEEDSLDKEGSKPRKKKSSGDRISGDLDRSQRKTKDTRILSSSSGSDPSDSSSISPVRSKSRGSRGKLSSSRDSKLPSHTTRRRQNASSDPSSSSSDSKESSSDSSGSNPRKRRFPTKKRRRRRSQRRGLSSDSSEDLQAGVMQSLVQMTKFQKKSYQ
jgi:hypothetical protein